MRDAWAWAGRVSEFLGVNRAQFERALTDHYRHAMRTNPSARSVAAWREEFQLLRPLLKSLVDERPEVALWGIVFEYELPLEGSRRPDVLILTGESVLVLEFKTGSALPLAAKDQVRQYARDIQHGHSASHGLRIVPVVVRLRDGRDTGSDGAIAVLGPEGLRKRIADEGTSKTPDVEAWLASVFAPSPTLIVAAKRIFKAAEVSRVVSAQSAKLEEALDRLAGIVDGARAARSKVLVLVTGVPGAGKTVLGLRLVYERVLGEATFYSGNGPLIQVLRHVLRGESGVVGRGFVRDLHAFTRDAAERGRRPTSNVLVFDEAQRMWTEDRMAEKWQITSSEPQIILDAASAGPDWCVVLGLVGTGQEIYLGEEQGLTLWNEAILRTREEWSVVCPPSLAHVFPAAGGVTSEALLDLSEPLRFGPALGLRGWVEHLLAGEIGAARREFRGLSSYPGYLTRDLDEARVYLRNLYGTDTDKRYGLLISSHVGSGRTYGLDIRARTMQPYNQGLIGAWFTAAPSDPVSSCAMVQPMTEFQTQGLELDHAVVCWGRDLVWSPQGWRTNSGKRWVQRADDGDRLVMNAYRVLLTRSRDGVIVYLPDDREFDQTGEILLQAGLAPLAESIPAAAAEDVVPYGNGA